jgi:hypothetical protein
MGIDFLAAFGTIVSDPYDLNLLFGHALIADNCMLGLIESPDENAFTSVGDEVASLVEPASLGPCMHDHLGPSILSGRDVVHCVAGAWRWCGCGYPMRRQWIIKCEGEGCPRASSRLCTPSSARVLLRHPLLQVATVRVRQKISSWWTAVSPGCTSVMSCRVLDLVVVHRGRTGSISCSSCGVRFAFS